jgi:hypothetical protein
MTVDVHVHAATVGELHAEMRALLNGESQTTAAAPITAEVGRLTPAQKKAAEKAAKEAAAAAAGTGQGISTGEERAETAQDAKDEAADTKAATPEPVKLNHDSVRAMLGGYVQAYGMAAAQEDGVKLIGTAKISELKDDQAVLAKAVIEIGTGIEKNPHKRDIAGDGITAEKLAELKPIVAAALAVK